MMRWDVVNAVAAAIGAERYLEVGVAGGETFHRVRCADKTGVDPASAQATHRVTSREFFESLSPGARFDLVFVDGDHAAQAALDDAWMSIARLSPGGAVVMHDCSPPTAEYLHPSWCGTAWRAWVALRSWFPGSFAVVVDCDLGCGVLVPGAVGTRGARPPSPISVPTGASRGVLLDPAPGEWAAFAEHRAAALGLVSPDEFAELLRELRPVRRRGDAGPG